MMRDSDVQKEIDRLTKELTKRHYSNTDNPVDFPKSIGAGADMMAGDGGYSIGTQEGYEEFVKNRNKVIIRKDIDKMLLGLLGRYELIEKWWHTPNKAFDDQTPYSVYLSGEEGRLKVYNYVGGFCYG